ncbi:MAG: hypothetical protein AB8G11_04710 [Saprospiraceae bacterium]
MIENLKKGILFEADNYFIPWTNTFKDLKNENVEIVEQGDRTIYKFGKQKVLNGLELDWTSMKWSWIDKNVPFAAIKSYLGEEDFGRIKAQKIKEHLVKLFGEPNDKNEEKERKMSLRWIFDNVRISIVGIEQFAMKYTVRIGWIDEPNWK